MAFQVGRLLAHNAGRIAAMKEDLQKVTEVLAKAKPDNVEAQEEITNARIAELDELEVSWHRQNIKDQAILRAKHFGYELTNEEGKRFAVLMKKAQRMFPPQSLDEKIKLKLEQSFVVGVVARGSDGLTVIYSDSESTPASLESVSRTRPSFTVVLRTGPTATATR